MELVHPFQYVSFAILLYSSNVGNVDVAMTVVSSIVELLSVPQVVNKTLSGPLFPFLVRQLLSGTVARPAKGGGTLLVARVAT